jgi:hypothetical protein
MKHFLLAAIFVVLPCAGFAASSTPEYSIQAIRYASAEDDVADLVMGAPHEEMHLAMVVWLIRGGGRNILFDSGYHRDTFLKEFPSTEYIRPDEAVKLAGVQPEDITDIVISHATGITWVASTFFLKPQSGFRKRSFAITRETLGSPAAITEGSTRKMLRNS